MGTMGGMGATVGRDDGGPGQYPADAQAGARYLAAAVGLSTQLTGVTARSAGQVVARVLPGFRLRGLDQQLSVWDLFVLWHWTSCCTRVTAGRLADCWH